MAFTYVSDHSLTHANRSLKLKALKPFHCKEKTLKGLHNYLVEVSKCKYAPVKKGFWFTGVS